MFVRRNITRLVAGVGSAAAVGLFLLPPPAGAAPTGKDQPSPDAKIGVASQIQFCGVFSGTLRCLNSAPTSVRNYPDRTDSWQVDVLRTTYSWFNCWTYGGLHSGFNRTWYGTVGDDTHTWGYVPASAVSTSSSFDANPGAYGLRHC